jgi:hypothetical protein
MMSEVHKKVGKAIFGDPVAESDKIMKPVVDADRNLEQCIAHLTGKIQSENLRLGRDTNSEAKAIRRTQHQTLWELRQGFEKQKRNETTADYWKNAYEQERKRNHESVLVQEVRDTYKMLTDMYRLVQDRYRYSQLGQSQFVFLRHAAENKKLIIE